MAPQIIMIVLLSIGLFNSAMKHGKKEEKTENFFISLLSTVIYTAILIFGGFFNVFNQ
jgi:uncharacterized membrane protein YiaA